jgi:hypothetical protein
MIRIPALIALILLTAPVIYPQTNTIAELEDAASKIRNENIYYNLGIEYLKQNDIGRAILNLKRAALLNPYDPDIQEALTSARETIGIPGYFFEATPLEGVLLFPFTVFNFTGMLIFGLSLFIIGSIVLSLVLSGIAGRMDKRWVRVTSIIAIITGVIYIAGLWIRYEYTFDSSSGVVLTGGVISDRPDNTAVEKKDLTPGIECRIGKELEGYYYITTIDGKEGWTAMTNIGRVWRSEGGQ